MSPIDNNSSERDLCERLREIEELPVSRELKMLMQIGAVLSNWTDDLAELLSDSDEISPSPAVKPKFDDNNE